MKIAGIDLGDKPLFLAPMEDVTDPSFRYVCKMFGADMVYTEFISCDGLIRDAAKTVAKLRLYDYERPVGIQLYGHQIEPMVEAARVAEAFERYGVDGVMIGRATYGRPWIFREIRQFLSTGMPMKQPSVRERVELAKLHLAKSLEFKGEKVGVLEMRRHLSCYFKGLPDFKATRLKLVTLTDPEQIVATLDEIARVWGDYDASEIVPKPLSHEV